jgi:hypothetical protein
MTYTKPNVAVVGNATEVIQGAPKQLFSNPEGDYIEVTGSYETEE